MARISKGVIVSDEAQGEPEGVGEDEISSSGETESGAAAPSPEVEAPVSVEHPDPSVAPAGSDTVDPSESTNGVNEVDPSVSAPGITTSAGVDSGQTDHSVDYSKDAEAFGTDVSAQSPDLSQEAQTSQDAHVDLSGADTTKNDEIPSARDGVAVNMAQHGGVQYSDGVCPLLASDDDIKRQRESVSFGTLEQTSKQPYNVLVNPIECPTCKKQIEGHQLVWDPTNPGVRDCAVATSQRAHPVSKEILAASDSGDDAKAARIAKRHPFGERILEILGLKEKSEA